LALKASYSIQDVEKWRGYYNRYKHTSRTPPELQEYKAAKKDLTEILVTLRESCTQIILLKLYIMNIDNSFGQL